MSNPAIKKLLEILVLKKEFKTLNLRKITQVSTSVIVSFRVQLPNLTISI
jgi:hypothetical protein